MVKGGEFLIKALGVLFPFRAGDLACLRGHEISHSTNTWKGDERYCFVKVFHEMPMRAADNLPEGVTWSEHQANISNAKASRGSTAQDASGKKRGATGDGDKIETEYESTGGKIADGEVGDPGEKVLGDLDRGTRKRMDKDDDQGAQGPAKRPRLDLDTSG